MADSNTDIANLAISHLGIGKEIAALDTENSQEANACRRYYEEALKCTLRDFPWPFASRFATLALIEEDPDYEEWGYSYRYPSGALLIKRILSGARNDSRQTRIAYKIGSDDSGGIIYTDADEAQVEYTKYVTDVLEYPSDFIMAFSWKLAFYVASRLTGGDPFQLRKTALQMYDYEIKRAQANGANEEQSDEEPQSEFIRARD